MSTKFSPTYTTLVMGFLDQKLYQWIENKFDIEMDRQFESFLKRYLDDCFVIWTKSDEEFKMFSYILKSLHTSIKFTVEVNYHRLLHVSFLDTMIIKKDNDTHQYFISILAIQCIQKETYPAV